MTRNETKRTALYARVSTDGKAQQPENQLAQLRVWCQRMGYEIVGEYVDYESGAKGRDRRPEYARLFADASRREFDMVVVWALDRFSRSGLTGTVLDLQRLSSHGVSFHSFTEPHLSTDNELVRDVLLAVLASLAKLERLKIGERTRAGLQRARANGKRLGRAPFSSADREKLRMVLDTGRSWRAASAETGLPYSTVKKHAKLMGYTPGTQLSSTAAETIIPHGQGSG
jgi:DNA invertase Pin-like site-specific DNA recombinase